MVRPVLLLDTPEEPASRGEALIGVVSGKYRVSNRDNNQQAIRSYGEFDPGSERTLMACLIHASRAHRKVSGERVSNA